ncbi:glycosyltransferase family 4 protein [Candidatus Parcubacteria bacterium]|nr:MAG: glycosyltransferase family 4 protein [Candidatus Parcubacteria bacterium]
MRILALMPDAYGGFGGIAQYNRDLLDVLCNEPRIETVYSLARSRPQNPLPLPKKLLEICSPGSAVFYMGMALRLGLKIQPDVIVCGHIHLLPAAGMIKRLTGSPILLETYGIDVWEPRRGNLFDRLLKQVDLVISISRYTRQRLLQWADIPPERVKVVPNAIHLERYRPGEKPAYLVKRYALKGKKVLLTVGRLSASERYKGHDRILTLLPALVEKYPNLVYVIVGDGDDRIRLEALARDLDMGNYVRFTGCVPDQEIMDHYHLADAFAMPSTGEGFGFVFLEAAACGVPVLGGSVDGSRDALMDGRLGVMVDPNDEQKLCAALNDVLGMPRKVPEGIQRFSYERFNKQVRELVDELRRR